MTNHVAFYWAKVDAWFEEDEQVLVHPRDPYKRIDVMASSRHVKVIVDGETVAETARPYLLFETGMPSQTTSQCPYKGRTEYWTVPRWSVDVRS